MQTSVICTIIAKNYLAQARNLTESFLKHHPDGRVFVLFADKIDGYFDPEQEQFTALEAHELNIPDFDQMAFRYTVLEFNTAVKPFLLEYLFEKYQLSQLCYFDPDIYFYQPITAIQELLETHSVVLTPHLLAPLEDQHMPDEAYILRAGIYNLGFIGLSRTEHTIQLLHWWQQKLVKDCVVDSSRGLFVDQRWIDFVPAFFDDVAILRDPGYNAAYWNLKHRTITCYDGTWQVNDGPLTFYHFSGLPMSDISAISKHQDRYTLADLPDIAPLFTHYHERLFANGHERVSQWPYAYGTFDNGVKILDAARHLWRNLQGERRWPRPFEADGAQSFFHWLNQEVYTGGGSWPLISNLVMELYRQRWDLQQAFPDVLGVHREAYARWFAHSAKEQYQLDDAFVLPVQQSIAKGLPSLTKDGAADTLAATVTISQQSETVRTTSTGATLRQAVRTTLIQLNSRSNVVEAPLIGPLTLRRRAYYAIRNPLRRLRIHEPMKRLLGQQIVERIYARMVATHDVQPEGMTRAAVIPPHDVFYRAPAEPLPPVAQAGLNVVGYLRAETGMGEVPRAVLRALDQAGYPVAQTDLSNADWTRANDTSVLHLPQGNPYACNLLCVNADMLPAVMQQLGPGFFEGKYTIGLWHWETSQFPAEWQDRFRLLDELWVDSGFVHKALAAVSPIPVVNIPLAVNAMAPSERAPRTLSVPADTFVVFFSFDMLSFVERKNPFGVIEAYRRAFGPAYEGVKLVIKVTNADKFPEEAAKLRTCVEAVSGILIDKFIDRDELASLFDACDVYISLHRSEGFGLTMAEAMALGKPVIATAYSGNMEFMTPANSYLVGYRLVDIERDYGPYRRGQQWAEPDIDHAAQLLRHVYTDRDDAQRKAANATADMRQYFGSEQVAAQIIKRLDQIRAFRSIAPATT